MSCFTVPLYVGSLRVTIGTVETEAKIKIKNDYEVRAEFKFMGITYVFVIKKWCKTQEQVKNASSTFNKFALLLMEKFSECSDMFGSIQESENGFQLQYTPAEIINIIKYGTNDVFVCAEQIILNYRRSLLDYCIYHREIGKCDTYESYIHLVACHCLVHCNFHAPDVKFDIVEFASSKREYNHDAFSKYIDTKENEEVASDL